LLNNYKYYFLIFSFCIVFQTISAHSLCGKNQAIKTLESKHQPAYYNCKFYNYFASNSFILSTEDSLNLINYADSMGVISDAGKLNGEIFKKLTCLLPRIWNSVDKDWHDQLILDKNGAAKYKRLSKIDLTSIINSDAIIVGKVIAEQFVIDTSQCYYFKSTLYVKVSEVINANFNLSKGDIVMIKSPAGYMGGCAQKSNYYTKLSAGNIYQKGVEDVFLLQHHLYKAWFANLRQDSIKQEVFSDVFCKQAFMLPPLNYRYSLSNPAFLKDIKLFYLNKDDLFKSLFKP